MVGGKGIKNIDIEKNFSKRNKQRFKTKLYGCLFSSDLIRKYINFYDVIKQKKAKYPFAIFNTDR